MATDTFTTTPAGALLLLGDKERDTYIVALHELPQTVFITMSSPHSGAFIRGLAKTHDLPLEYAPYVALTVLKIALGKELLARLPAILSTQLKIPNDKANLIAKEIEKEIFAPIALEWNQFLAKRKQQGVGKSMADKLQSSSPPVSQTSKAGPTPLVKRGASLKPQNMLNLRDQRRPPAPPTKPAK